MIKALFLMTALLVPYTAYADDHNIVILLDTSGSMEEQMKTTRQSKWEAAKFSLLNIVDKIPENTNVGLLLFDPSDWVYELGPVDRLKLTQAIRESEITPNSGTPLGTYIKKGADVLLAQREKSSGYGTYKLLVVTDGDPTNEPPGLVSKYLPDIISRGIVVECIGVSMNDKSILYSQVHKYMSADDPDTLTEQILSTVAVKEDIDENIDDSVFKEVGGFPADRAKLVIDTIITTGNHPIGERAVDDASTIADQDTELSDDSPTPFLDTVLVFGAVLLCVMLVLSFVASLVG